MYPRPILLCIASVIFLAPVYAQLHLIAGSPNPTGSETFAAALLRVEGDGVVKAVAQLVPKSSGTALITLSYDWRKAFIDSAENGGTLMVLDFDKAAVVKSCKNPNTPGMAGVEHWLADSPELGPAYEGHSWSTPPNIPVVEGMSLDPAVPCIKSFAAVDPSDIGYIAANGQAAVAGLAPFDGTWVAVAAPPASGTISKFIGKRVELPFHVPAELRKGVKHPAALVISDSYALVLSLPETETGHRTLVFRKEDSTWHVLPAPSEFYTLRSYGQFIGVTEIQPASSQNLQSVGSEEWRRGASAMGPDLAARFSTYRLSRSLAGVFPGHLYLYDVATEKMSRIATNQADSEILLVEDGLVYYRVSDRLYAAEISEKGIAAPRLIARADAIRDAHWAFMKH